MDTTYTYSFLLFNLYFGHYIYTKEAKCLYISYVIYNTIRLIVKQKVVKMEAITKELEGKNASEKMRVVRGYAIISKGDSPKQIAGTKKSIEIFNDFLRE